MRFLILVAFLGSQIHAQPPTLKSILLEQLRTAHNKEEWFVPVNIAIAGLTPEQAKWTDAKGDHSIGQLANHLLFWNSSQMAKFKGDKPAAYNGNNDETFNNFDSKTWKELVRNVDANLTEWEKVVAAADDAKLEKWAPIISRIAMHNAYHVGQILYVRKMQGVWDPSKGVK